MKLIDKSILVAEIKKLEKIYCYDNKTNSGLVAISIFENINNVIDTLEVKEVDLDKEIEKCLKKHSMLAVGKKDFTDIAKHFFELGLQARTDKELVEEVYSHIDSIKDTLPIE